MIAQFYIIGESLQGNSASSIADIESKIAGLARDYHEIRKHPLTNLLSVHEDVYSIEFIPGATINDILYSGPGGYGSAIDRDKRILLKTIFTETAITSINREELLNALDSHNQENCAGLMGFNLVSGINREYQIIYLSDSWLNYRRSFLRRYPQNPNFFIDECRIYFPELFFHDGNKETVGAILSSCVGKIIYHLTALNDKFRTYQVDSHHRTDVLKKFSTGENLDETATLASGTRRKKDFEFNFVNISGNIEAVCCDSHMKLCWSDLPGDTCYSNDRRIYFNEGQKDIHQGKILIGHIGVHL